MPAWLNGTIAILVGFVLCGLCPSRVVSACSMDVTGAGAAAQGDPPRGSDDQPGGADADPASATPAPPQFANPTGRDVLNGGVEIDLKSFGLGNRARAGEWVGLRFEVRDSATKQRNVIVRLSARDADGDEPEFVRQIATNPGVWQSVWLYLRLPFGVEPVKDLSVSVFESIEDESVVGGATPGVRTGRLLARRTAAPSSAQSLVDPTMGLIAIMGRADYGLSRYSIQDSRGGYSPTGHEPDLSVSGLSPSDLPDRWMGLQQFSVLIWGEGDPGELRSERARAVREWVERGGHLVVILPAVGENWSNRGSNELHGILPIVTLNRREGVDLERYRALFTTEPGVKPSRQSDRIDKDQERPEPTVLPNNAVVYGLPPAADATPAEAIRVIDGPDGDCIVARRLVGMGMVTMIGLDLNRQVLASGRAINPEILWHRILGKRGRLLKSPDAQALQLTNSLGRPSVPLDQDIPREISTAGRSAAGVLLGLVVFAAYWLVAGPVGFLLLKNRGITRHAWIAFLGVGILFTVLAWGGATAIRPSKPEATHVTLIDHVYGQPIQRTRSFMGVLIPRYGTATLSVGAADEGGSDPLGRRSTNLISHWESVQGRQWRTFPDARGYATDSRAPDTIRFPVRATVKEIQADWAGGPRWLMPRPVGPDGQPGMIKLTNKLDAPASEASLEGVLIHELPAPLEDVRIIVITGQQGLPSPGVGVRPPEFTASGTIFVRTGEWPAGERLDLGIVTKVGAATRVESSLRLALDKLLDPYDESGLSNLSSNAAADPNRAGDRFIALALFSQLRPPPEPTPNAQKTPAVARRSMVHGWDITRWFTQPCVIIIGTVGSPARPVESPTPMLLDGEPLATKGRTLVRWVYPLPGNPPVWRDRGPTESGQPAKLDSSAPAGGG